VNAVPSKEGSLTALISIIKADTTFHDPEFHRKEMALLSSRNATREDFVWIATLMKARRLHETSMITHRDELDAVPKRMAAWCALCNAVIKAMIHLDH